MKEVATLYCLTVLFLTSCNTRELNELKAENEQLERKVSLLESQIEEQNEEIEILTVKNEELDDFVSKVKIDMSSIQTFASSIRSSSSSIDFWTETGHRYFPDMQIRSIESDAKQIADIASNYN